MNRRRPDFAECERRDGRDERARELSDSEWGRLNELAIEGITERVRRESREALDELRKRNLEVPDATHNR